MGRGFLEIRPETICINIDWCKSLQELYLAGKYDYSQFDPQYYRFDDPFEPLGVGQQIVTIKFVRLMVDLESREELLDLIRSEGLQPAGVFHLFSLGVAHPNIQRSISVASLEYGSGLMDCWWPILTGNAEERIMSCYGWTTWGDHFPWYGPDGNLWYLVIQP